MDKDKVQKEISEKSIFSLGRKIINKALPSDYPANSNNQQNTQNGVVNNPSNQSNNSSGQNNNP